MPNEVKKEKSSCAQLLGLTPISESSKSAKMSAPKAKAVGSSSEDAILALTRS